MAAGTEHGRRGEDPNGTQAIPEFLMREKAEIREAVLEMVKETWEEREAVDRFVWDVTRRRGIFGISTST